MVGESNPRIQRLGLLNPPWRLGTGSLFELIGDVRTTFRAVGIAVGISVRLSSASAEIEEVSDQGYISNYSESAFTHNFVVNLVVNNDRSITVEPGNFMDNLLYGDGRFTSSTTAQRDKSGPSTNQDNFGEALIPEAIWSLDVSTGVHLDRVFGEFGSQIIGYQDLSDWWTNVIIGSGKDKNGNIIFDSPALPPQFQVASCHDKAIERSNPEYCNISYELTNQYSGDDTQVTGHNNSNDDVVTPDIDLNSIFSPIQTSNPSSALIQQTQPLIVHDLSLLAPAGVNSFVLQGHLADRSNPPDQCNDVSAYCATIQFTIPIVDSSTPPDFSGPIVPVSDPWPVSDPLPAPPAVPETSTWIMMLIGFGIMVAVCRRRSWNPIMQSSGRTFVKSVKKYMA